MGIEQLPEGEYVEMTGTFEVPDWRGIADQLYQALRDWGIAGATARDEAMTRYQEALTHHHKALGIDGGDDRGAG